MNRPIHFEMLCTDPGKMSEFYAELFGWEIATWEGGEQGYWMATTGGEGAPGIDGAFMGRHFPQAVINTVEVESLEETIARVEAAGGKLEHGPNEVPSVGTHAYCTDPEGNWFGILEPVAES